MSAFITQNILQVPFNDKENVKLGKNGLKDSKSGTNSRTVLAEISNTQANRILNQKSSVLQAQSLIKSEKAILAPKKKLIKVVLKGNIHNYSIEEDSSRIRL